MNLKLSFGDEDTTEVLGLHNDTKYSLLLV